eukprot:scaffold11929_cov107-Isochrysis_galbana.AAC.12
MAGQGRRLRRELGEAGASVLSVDAVLDRAPAGREPRRAHGGRFPRSHRSPEFFPLGRDVVEPVRVGGGGGVLAPTNRQEVGHGGGGECG